MKELNFKSGYWYKLDEAGHDAQDWTASGNMDFMKDGEWHQCNEGNGDEASFYDCSIPYMDWAWAAPEHWHESKEKPVEEKFNIGDAVRCINDPKHCGKITFIDEYGLHVRWDDNLVSVELDHTIELLDKDNWTILDLKNAPDLTSDYFWQWDQNKGEWIDLTSHTFGVMRMIFDAKDAGVNPGQYRYCPKPKKRTLEDVAKILVEKDFHIDYMFAEYIMKGIEIGFRAKASGEYDDVELED